ncbi:MAG: hypothetical protein WC057_05315, partial [Dehalococcoidales bacterium]
CKANIGVSVYTSRGCCSVKVTIEAPFLCHKILYFGILSIKSPNSKTSISGGITQLPKIRF